jgi:hypothetical protein
MPLGRHALEILQRLFLQDFTFTEQLRSALGVQTPVGGRLPEATEMKSKKGILLTIVALVLVSAVAFAAGGDKWAKMKADLNLTDAQVTQLQEKFKQLDPLMEKAMALKKEIQILEKATPPDQKAIEASKNELATLKKAWTSKAEAIYKSVLTTEQLAKLKDLEAKDQKEQAAKK